MEWGDFQQYFALQDSNGQSYNNLSSFQLFESGKEEWTFEENKLFENALTEIEPDSLGFFERIASKIPWKSIDEIKIHYQALVEDLDMIASGLIPTPDYQTHYVDYEQKHINVPKETPKNAVIKELAPSNIQPKKTINGQQRRRGVPWTEAEHQLFLMGLNKYGKGDWRSISRYYVISKTPTQVASHAQKYFRRQTSSTPADRRRPSIHDIHIVNPIIPATTSIIGSSSSSCGDLFPLLNHNFNMNGCLSSCAVPYTTPVADIMSQMPNPDEPYMLMNQQQYWG